MEILKLVLQICIIYFLSIVILGYGEKYVKNVIIVQNIDTIRSNLI